MTRVLQSRLTLANVKIKHGWENLSLDTIEPQIELELKRKRPTSSSDPMSDTSSSVSGRFGDRALDSSPLTAPLFSDDLPRSGSIYGTVRRGRYQQSLGRRAESSNHSRVRATGRNGMRVTSWKSTYQLPESSPIHPQRQASMFSSASKRHPSFMMDHSQPDDEDAAMQSEEDDEDLPTLPLKQPKFQRPSPRIPPRTPSPDPVRSGRIRSRPFAQPTANEEGADLLMFLATSPSPANGRTIRKMEPSTPPPRSTPLPSSMMTTPGGSGGGFLSGLITTPGMNFNFSDYLNVTPSPAQAAWRTPGVSKTPLAVRETRKRLNFDALLPPGASPLTIHTPDTEATKGLGMELGGELVSSQ